MANWLSLKELEQSIAVSSRVRLARNIIDYPFPNKMDAADADELTKRITEIVTESNVLKDEYHSVIMKEKTMLQKSVLLEKHLISKELLAQENSAAIIKDDETASILINEEDHLRIQVLYDGFRVDDAYQLCDHIDDLLGKRLSYAFSQQLGYITSCPTNLGTGMRASVMLHLPALMELGYINSVLQSASQIGLAVRGLYGEGSQFTGSLFQISNQLTLGISEEEILANIMVITRQITEREIEAERILSNKLGLALEDRISRSAGILSSARLISAAEAVNHLSNIKLGIRKGIIKNLSSHQSDKLMIQVQPANQSIMHPKVQSNNASYMDKSRADFLRSIFKDIILD